MPGELHALLARCRAGEAPAWEHFAAWVKARGRAVLGGLDKLGDVLADLLQLGLPGPALVNGNGCHRRSLALLLKHELSDQSVNGIADASDLAATAVHH